MTRINYIQYILYVHGIYIYIYIPPKAYIYIYIYIPPKARTTEFKKHYLKAI